MKNPVIKKILDKIDHYYFYFIIISALVILPIGSTIWILTAANSK